MKMMKLAAGLMAATCLTAPVLAQEAGVRAIATGDNSGTNGPIQDFGDHLPGWFAGYQGFEITVTNAASLAVYLHDVVSSFVFSGAVNAAQVFLFDSTSPELSTMSVSDMFADPGMLTLLSGTTGSTLTLPGTVDDGQYMLYVLSYYGAPGDVLSYTIDFELFGAIFGWGPTVEEQLEETGAALVQTSLGLALITKANVRNAVQSSFASRDASVDVALDGEINQMMGNAHVWMRNTAYKSTSEDRTFTSPFLQLGADLEVRSNLLAGLSVGHGKLSASSAEMSFRGDQTVVQPYLGWRNDDWRGTATVTFGNLSYDEIEHSGGTAAAKGRLRAVNLELARDIAMKNGSIFSPVAGLSVGSLELTETSGTLDGSDFDEAVGFSRFSIGAETRRAGALGELVVGLMAEHTSSDAEIDLVSGSFDQTGWSGRVSVALQADLNNGFGIDTGISFGGLGSVTQDASAHFELSKRF